MTNKAILGALAIGLTAFFVGILFASLFSDRPEFDAERHSCAVTIFGEGADGVFRPAHPAIRFNLELILTN